VFSNEELAVKWQMLIMRPPTLNALVEKNDISVIPSEIGFLTSLQILDLGM
jgi:hypothetical protein